MLPFCSDILYIEDGLFTSDFQTAQAAQNRLLLQVTASNSSVLLKAPFPFSPQYTISKSSLIMYQHTCPYDLYYSTIKKHTPENKPSKTSLIAFHRVIKLKWLMTDSSKDQNQRNRVDVSHSPE